MSELSPTERVVDEVLRTHFGYEPEADERAGLASTIVMALSPWLEMPHCGCLWCAGETRANGDCWCEFCRHRQGDI